MKEEKVNDLTNKSNEELLKYYSKLSENILFLETLLQKTYTKEDAIKIFHKVKNK